MICTTCSASNRETANFCRQCGLALVSNLPTVQQTAPNAIPEPCMVAEAASRFEFTSTEASAPSLVPPAAPAVLSHSRQCQRCARAFRQSDVYCVQCGVKLHKPHLFLLMTCGHCGSETHPEHRFCPACGQPGRVENIGAANELFAEQSRWLPGRQA